MKTIIRFVLITLTTFTFIISESQEIQRINSPKESYNMLGGYNIEGSLHIFLYNNSNIQVHRFYEGNWHAQWYGVSSKSIWLYADSTAFCADGSYFHGNSEKLTTVSNIKINDNTNELILEKPEKIKIKQISYYPPGSDVIFFTWEITNLSDQEISDLRLFDGGDTFFYGSDNGAGFWLPTDNTVGAKKIVGNTIKRMYIEGVTAPFAYESRYYWYLYQSVTSNVLKNIIDENELTDNGMALEFRMKGLAPGKTWIVSAIEKFNTSDVTNIIVTAPLTGLVRPGQYSDLKFVIQNRTISPSTINLLPEVDKNEWSVQLISPSSPFVLPGNSSANVIVRVFCPEIALSGENSKVTLKAVNQNGTASDICFVIVALVPKIVEQPMNQNICKGLTATFRLNAGYAESYQWQEFDTIWRDISDTGIYGGSGTSALTISDVPSYMNNNKYRCIVSNSYGSVSSNNAILTVYEPAVIVNQPVSATICEGNNTSYHIAATGEGLTYQWQVNAKAGYYNVLNGGVYNGATTNSLVISGAPYTMNEYIYRCVIGNSCSPDTISNEARLTVERAPYISDQPISSAICEGENTSFSITALGYGLSYQWQANEGSGFINIVNGNVYSGVNTNILSVTNAGTAMNGYEYRCAVNGSCLPPAISNEAVLIVNERPVVNLGNDTLLCENQTITLDAGPGISYIWSYPELNGQIVTINYALLGLGTHPVSVIVTNAGNCEGSDTIEITYTICTGQNSYNQDSEIELIPNPTSGLFCINLPASIEKAGIEIYNMTGTRVMKEKIYRTFQISVDMSKLAKGTYTIKIITENQIIFKKMIVY
jgi:hypothetical protein